jgi:hypothetical protein
VSSSITPDKSTKLESPPRENLSLKIAMAFYQKTDIRVTQKVQNQPDHETADYDIDPRLRITPLTPEEEAKVEEMSLLHCLAWEIAYTLHMTTKAWHDYLRFFPDLDLKLKAARARGAKGLRMVQMRAALEGNTTMQIWLGRAILGQNKDQTTVSSVQTELTDVSEDAKKHLAELTSVIYNNPQLRDSKAIDVESESTSVLMETQTETQTENGHHAME